MSVNVANLSSRMEELKRCMDGGLIGAEEYAHMRKLLCDKFLELPSTQPGRSGHAASCDDVFAEHALPKSKGGIPKFDRQTSGFCHEDAMQYVDEHQKSTLARTPRQVLEELQKGNARFWGGYAVRPEKSAFQRRALIAKQFPSVAVLSCSDSRVPVEIVFDQGLGDMFVVRNAGNCLGTSALASLQFAVDHLKVKVIIVMGHEGCGAVKAAQASAEALEQHPEELSTLLKYLRLGLQPDQLSCVSDARARDREAGVSNVQFQVAQLARDKSVLAAVRNKELMVAGAFYEMSSGIVDFLAEISDETLSETLQQMHRTSAVAQPRDFAAVAEPMSSQSLSMASNMCTNCNGGLVQRFGTVWPVTYAATGSSTPVRTSSGPLRSIRPVLRTDRSRLGA